MNNETQKVDVLAVLRFMASNDWDGDALPGNAAVDATVAALAELIQACRRATCQCPRGAWKTDEHPLGVHQHDCHLGNIPAALARIGVPPHE